jgi:hypothetical protein
MGRKSDMNDEVDLSLASSVCSPSLGPAAWRCSLAGAGASALSCLHFPSIHSGCVRMDGQSAGLVHKADMMGKKAEKL